MLLTGAVFADALQGLQHNREQLWREFGVALPPSASLPRFDQRAESHSLPSGAGDLPAPDVDLRRVPSRDCGFSSARRLRTSPAGGVSVAALQNVAAAGLQLHAKATLASAVDAVRAFPDPASDASGRRAGAEALQPSYFRCAANGTTLRKLRRFSGSL